MLLTPVESGDVSKCVNTYEAGCVVLATRGSITITTPPPITYKLCPVQSTKASEGDFNLKGCTYTFTINIYIYTCHQKEIISRNAMTCNEKLLRIAHIIARPMYTATNTPLGAKYPPFLCVPVASIMIICSACAPENAYSPSPKRSKEKPTFNNVNKDQGKNKPVCQFQQRCQRSQAKRSTRMLMAPIYVQPNVLPKSRVILWSVEGYTYKSLVSLRKKYDTSYSSNLHFRKLRRKLEAKTKNT